MNPALIAPVFEMGRALIAKLFPDPQQKAAAELELLRMQQEGDLKEIESRLSAIIMEAQSKDPWTSRARPSFLYVFYAILLSLVIIAPLAGILSPFAMEQFFANVARGFQAIPEELWWTFSVGYLGYSGVRTFEKTRRP